MDNIARIGLVIFIVYLPIFLVLLLIAVRKHRGYSFTSLWMSNLGDTRFRSSVLFNSAFLFYGIVSLFFVYGLSQILPNIFISMIAIIFLYLSCLSTIIASQIPMDKNLRIHHKFSNMVFIGITISSALLVYPIFVSSVIPQYFLTLNVLLIALSTVLCVSFAELVKKEGKIPVTLFEIRKKGKSFLMRNAAVQEWTFFLVVLVWNFVISLIILKNLYI